MQQFLKNYISTMWMIGIWYFYYSQVEHFNSFFLKNLTFEVNLFQFNTIHVFEIIILLYALLLIPFYIFHTQDSKALIIVKYVQKKVKSSTYTISNYEKTSILAWCVKLFFAPLMILFLTDAIVTISNNTFFAYWDRYLLEHSFIEFFNKHIFWWCFAIILWIDVLFYTLWYLIESPRLKNSIKSVEPTALGWWVVLICYPPFNTWLTNFIGWYSTNFPQFTSTYFHLFFNISILLLMGFYSYASVSLWLKASNLTNRGIITTWAYKYIRHPAYVCKNFAWWIGVLPLLVWNIQHGDITNTIIVISSMMAWSWIYYMRAKTEEEHLSSDPDYIEYKKNVPYKFIPKIW